MEVAGDMSDSEDDDCDDDDGDRAEEEEGEIAGKKTIRNTTKPKEKQEKHVFKFQYVSLAKSIAMIKKNLLVCSKPSEDGFIRDVKDGIAYKDSEYFQRNPDAYTILLYSDAVELANPLGEKKGVYKMVNIYFTLAEIPVHLRSRTDNIFLVLSIKEKDLKHNRDVVYKVLIDELAKLEKGVLVDGQFIKAGILAHTGDNLEQNCVGGFSMNFSSGNKQLILPSTFFKFFFE